MAANLHEERVLAEDTVARWLERNFDLKDVLQLVGDEESDGHPPRLWRAARELGWLATLIPEAYGGLGLSLADAASLVQALGRGVAPGPYLTSMLAAEAIRLGGSPAQQARLLPPMASGEAVATVAGTNLRPLRIEQRQARLSGHCGAVAFAALAGNIIVPVAAPSGGTQMWLVDTDAEGVKVNSCASVDGTWRVGYVSLSEAKGERLAGADDAWQTFVAHGAVLTAADLLGVAGRAIEITVDYARTRRQFDRAIGANQGVKHPIVDAYVATTMARKGLWNAAAALDSGEPHAPIAASVAKAKANDAAREATSAMIQFHGAMGFTWSHPAHLFFKRAKRQEYEFGDSLHHRERVAAHWIRESK